MVRKGKARRGAVWTGGVMCGEDRYGMGFMERYGLVMSGEFWRGMAGYGKVWKIINIERTKTWRT